MEHPRRSIVILDFGGQYAHLIARRVRECGAYSEILPPDVSIEKLKNVAGIILSGGPQSVYDTASPQADKAIFDLGVPVLGICYGHHWIAHALGGKVTSGHTKEYGHTDIEITGESPLFAGLPKKLRMWMSHGDEVSALPEGFVITARSADCMNAAMENIDRKIFGVQFHLEVVHSERGSDILKRFVDLCKADPWSIQSYAQKVGQEIMEQVKDRNVFMLVSGGVDSTVAFTLLNEVLGSRRVQGLLIDTGLMRKDEVRDIRNAFELLGIENLQVVDASKDFFEALHEVFDPEAKRKAIGDTFLAVQKRESEAMGLRIEEGWMLGQGTIYPDTIETGGTRHADKIKTHHNRVEAVQKMIEKGLVIEPLKELYKDEVRRLGEELGLPHDLVWRHPFPGPGLGVRILCCEEPDMNVMLDDPIKDLAVPHVVLPIQSVGVQGDGRTYRHAVVVFAEDPLNPPSEYRQLATSIPNRDPRFNRVLLSLSHNEPISFLAHRSFVTRERADLLREADEIVDEEMRRANLYQAIWQFPVVLLPVGVTEGGQTIVLRPVESTEAMTANAAVLPSDVCDRITKRLMKLKGVDSVLLDLTNKPPATIEWE